MDALTGKVINNYQIQDVIGAGGMGIVYRAFHPQLQAYAALKVMRPELADQPGFYERFLQEARTAKHLDHYSIVDVFDFGPFERSYYLMMDYVEGPNLRQIIRDAEKGLPLFDVAYIFSQIADVLAFAHTAGVLHRDLKPDNILLTRSTMPDLPYRVLVTDFGLVKLAENSLLETQAGIMVGTPAYMSPEQCQGEKVDKRTDLYSLGVMLFEVAAGRRPYPIKTLVEATTYHRSGQIPSLRGLRPDTPEPLDALVQRMLQISPDQRPADATEVLQSLRQLAAGLDKSQSHVLARLTGKEVGKPAVPTPPEIVDQTPRSAGEAQYQVRVAYQGQWETKTYPISTTPLMVGRQSPADVVLFRPGQSYVSRLHCEILLRDGRVLVRDLKSMNGTYLDATRLQPDRFYEWHPHQALGLGPFTLQLQAETPEERTIHLAGAKPVDMTKVQTTLYLVCPTADPPQVLLGQRPVILGRGPDCDLRLNHPHVSKHHCQVQRSGDKIEITDLGSMNGAYFKGQRLSPKTPVNWDTNTPLVIGPFTITLENKESKS
ncbi:MAG: FHA domain-containing serine/threonine-protein kinase [Chloroflexota bacterium]